jgi:hypothetical protein
MDNLSFTKSTKAKTKDKLLSILLVIVLFFMVFNSYNDNSKVALTIFSLLLIGSFVLLFKALSNKNTVVVNKEVIFNHTNGMGLTKWKFITGFEISNIRNAQILIIKINDFEELLSQKNGISRKLMKSNINKLGSPVLIMGSEFDQELTLVKDKLEKYRDSL